MLCQCRVWNKGYGAGCSRMATIQNEYSGKMMCKGHNAKVNISDWWCGYMDEPMPESPMVINHKLETDNYRVERSWRTPEEHLERDYINQTGIDDELRWIVKQDDKYYRVDKTLPTAQGYKVRLPFEDTIVGEFNMFEDCVVLN
jgi:hypothetical protein